MDRDPNAIDKTRLIEAQRRVDAEARSYPPGEIRRADPVFRLKLALDRFVIRQGLVQQISANELQRLWVSILGPAKAGMTSLGGVRRGILQVTVGNSSLMEELKLFRKPEILKRIRSSPVGSSVRDIRFRIGKVATGDDTAFEHATGPQDR